MVLTSMFYKEIKRMAVEAMDLCLQVLKESNNSRFNSYGIRNRVLIICHITLQDCGKHKFFNQPFLKIAICINCICNLLDHC